MCYIIPPYWKKGFKVDEIKVLSYIWKTHMPKRDPGKHLSMCFWAGAWGFLHRVKELGAF